MSRKFRITGVQIMAILALLGILFSAVGSALFMNQTTPVTGTPITGTPIVSSEVTLPSVNQ